MALKRADIRAIFKDVEGVSDDHIKKVLDMVHTEIDAVKDENDDLKEQIAKGGKDGQNWQKKYEDEHTAFEDYKKDQAKKESLASKKEAFKALLKDSGLSEAGQAKALKYTNIDDFKMSNGKFDKAADLIKNVKEEWSDYVTNKDTDGANTSGKDGAGSGGSGSSGSKKTKEEIMKITDAGERQKAMAENHELFGF